jgi:YD repeat-containing protein
VRGPPDVRARRGTDEVITVRHDGPIVTYAVGASVQRFTVVDGRLTRLDDDHDTWTWHYRDGGLAEVATDGAPPLRFERDARGRIVRHSDAREAWTYTYDAAGRLTAIGGWDAPVTVAYDGCAR